MYFVTLVGDSRAPSVPYLPSASLMTPWGPAVGTGRGDFNRREVHVLKKVVIAGVAAAAATMAVTGVAYANNGPNCSSHESTKQYNKGDQGVVGGNGNAKDINGGWLVGSIDKAGVCPTGLSNND